VLLALAIFTLESEVYVNIQITRIALVGRTAESSANLFTSLDGHSLGCIEHSLLPVSVLCMWSSRESHRLMARRECDIKPSNECMNIVITSSSQLEVASETQVFLGDCKNIDFLGVRD
jgi:hypothetical protein